jgi:hypothetical protein
MTEYKAKRIIDFNIENMKEYEITDKFREILTDDED